MSKSGQQSGPKFCLGFYVWVFWSLGFRETCASRIDVPMQQNIVEFSFPNAMDEIPEERFDEAGSYIGGKLGRYWDSKNRMETGVI